MEVEVRLFASLRRDRFRHGKLDVPEEATARDVLDRLRIAPREVAILLVNGYDAAVDRPLRANDVLSLFPLVAGG